MLELIRVYDTMTKYVSISLPVDIKYESTHKYSIDK